MRKYCRWSGLFVSLLLGFSCNPAINVETIAPPGRVGNICADWPEVLRSGCRKIYVEGTRNLVLNGMIVGLDALQLGYKEIAARCFDDAIAVIETIYANNARAAKARSNWVEEGYKDFKGEPYERAMTYFYRGLIDLINGEIDNARASFRGGSLQDAFAEEEQNRCDFALLIFLQGWCSQLLHEIDTMKMAYDEVSFLRNNFAAPSTNDNVLFLIELGYSPRKLTDGVGHAQLKFFRGRDFMEDHTLITIQEKSFVGYPLESIFWQASTRGARPIDYILDGKAKFRNTLGEIGSVGNNIAVDTYGTLYAGTPVGTAYNIIGAVGGIIGLIAGGVKPKADARYWSNLPDSVHFFSMQLPPGNHTATIRFFDQTNAPIADLVRQIDFRVSSAGPNIVWVRSRDRIITRSTLKGD